MNHGILSELFKMKYFLHCKMFFLPYWVYVTIQLHGLNIVKWSFKSTGRLIIAHPHLARISRIVCTGLLRGHDDIFMTVVKPPRVHFLLDLATRCHYFMMTRRGRCETRPPTNWDTVHPLVNRRRTRYIKFMNNSFH